MPTEHSWKSPAAILGLVGVLIAAAAIIVPIWLNSGRDENQQAQSIVSEPPSSHAAIQDESDELAGGDVSAGPAGSLSATAQDLSGTWEGTYRCSQGISGMTLIIFVESEGKVLATWNFYGVPDNPGIPSGSIAMKGTFGPSALNLESDYWIDQVGGYRLLDLSAPLNLENEQIIVGDVTPSCNKFEVRKTSSATQKPPI